MYQHKALGNHMSKAVRGYVVSTSFAKEVTCEVCGNHRGSPAHKKQRDKCSRIMQAKYALVDAK